MGLIRFNVEASIPDYDEAIEDIQFNEVASDDGRYVFYKDAKAEIDKLNALLKSYEHDSKITGIGFL